MLDAAETVEVDLEPGPDALIRQRLSAAGVVDGPAWLHEHGDDGGIVECARLRLRPATQASRSSRAIEAFGPGPRRPIRGCGLFDGKHWLFPPCPAPAAADRSVITVEGVCLGQAAVALDASCLLHLLRRRGARWMPGVGDRAGLPRDAAGVVSGRGSAGARSFLPARKGACSWQLTSGAGAARGGRVAGAFRRETVRGRFCRLTSRVLGDAQVRGREELARAAPKTPRRRQDYVD